MLSYEENALFTEVGLGSPGGDLLRRYWHPIYIAKQLSPQHPKAHITILGESLVLYVRQDGQYGLIEEHCPHRGVSLYYGFVESRGIRCAYHGWLFDSYGRCIDRPFEQPTIPCTTKARAYPVRELGGMIFAYLGPPDKEPLLPNWDILIRKDGYRYFEVQEDLACNWFQIQENAADVTHTYFLHAKSFEMFGIPDSSGFGLPLEAYGFQPFEWGLIKSWVYRDITPGIGWGNLLVFPNILRLETEMHWRVPVDDHTTRIFCVGFRPANEGGASPEPGIVFQPPRVDERGEYTMKTFSSQDAMALETQGRIYDRTREHLGLSDRGILLFRQMFRDQTRRVQNGEDPMGIVRDPQNNHCIDLRCWMNGYLPMSCPRDESPVDRRRAEQVFDERHEVFSVHLEKGKETGR